MVSVTCGQCWSKGIKQKNPEINNIHLKLDSILSDFMKSHTIPLCLSWDVSHPWPVYPSHVCYPPVSLWEAVWLTTGGYHRALFYFLKTQNKSSDADSFITLCYACLISLMVIVATLLSCLLYKLKLAMGT